MQDINTLIDGALGSIWPIRWVGKWNSWIIEQEEGGPKIRECRYFEFWGADRSAGGKVTVIAHDGEKEEAVTAYIRERLGLRRYSPGAEDISSLVGVWA